MRALRFAAFVATLSLSPLALAQEGPRKMTLEEATAYARAHHLRVVAAKQRLAAAQVEADVPSAQWLPRVGAMAEVIGATTNNSTTTLLNVPTVDLPRIGATKVEGDYSWKPYPSTANVWLY